MAFTNHIKRLVDCFNSSIMVTEGCFNMYTHTQPISLGWLHYPKSMLIHHTYIHEWHLWH